MYRTEKETSKGLKILLVISFVFLAAFILGFVLFGINANKTGDADLKDFAGVFSYHFGNMKDLFTFNINNASNIFYVALTGLVYGLIALVVIFLIVGIVVAVKKKRAIVTFGIVLVVLALMIYMLFATGLPKYWDILNKRNPFDTHKDLMLPTYIIIIAGALFALLSYITYFACIIEAFKNPAVESRRSAKKGEERVMFEPIVTEDAPTEEKASAPILEEPEPEEQIEEEEEDSISKKDLAELIRSIVRDEMSRNASQNNPYSGPLVVQYFGTVPTQQVEQQVKKEEPVPEKEPEPEPQPEPEVVPEEEPIPEPVPQEEVVEEEPVVEEVQPEPVPEEPTEKKPIIRIPFQARMINADDEMKRNYNELKNEILSYGVNSRVSNSGDAFRLHRKTYVKLTIAGLSLKLYFALNPEDYKDSPIPVQDAGHKGIYAEIPLVFKVKSGLSMRRCKELIQTVMEKDGLEQGPIGETDWVEKLKEQPVDESTEEE